MTILCTTDFSDLSEWACDAAGALAKKSGEGLVMLHVTTSESGDDREKIRTVAERLRKRGADVTERVESGDPVEVIAETAAEIQASLIVMGASGRRRSRWLGSTADGTISRAAVPVLAVREGFPITDWVEGIRPLRVAVATDLSPISENAVEWASTLRRYGGCDFAVLHVSWPPEAYQRLGIEGPMPLDRTHPVVEEIVRRDLASTVERLQDGGEPEVLIESSFGKPADSLTRLASQARADLLVVGHDPQRVWRIWEGSVAREVIRSAPMAIACIPDSAKAVVGQRREIRRIVAATDLSPHGNAAVVYALSIAPTSARVVVIHVLDEGVSDEQRQKIANELSALAAENQFANRGLDVRVEILDEENAARAIVGAAEREDADLLCVGTRGRSRLPRMLLGSVSQEVLLLSRRPVLVVP